MPRLNLRLGEHLFHQGDTAFGIFFVERGNLRLVRHTETGHCITMFRAGTGETFAEPSLFSPKYHCDAVADEISSVRFIDKSKVLSAMSNDPKFATNLIERLAGQVQGYRRRLELLAIRSAKDRVLAALADGWLTGTVVGFASDIGLCQEVVYRALSDLVLDGKVERSARGVYRLKCLD